MMMTLCSGPAGRTAHCSWSSCHLYDKQEQYGPEWAWWTSVWGLRL